MITTATPQPNFKVSDTSAYEMPGWRKQQAQAQRLMMDAFEAVLRQVVEKCLGREFVPEDAQRFVLGIPPNDPTARVLIFDGMSICTISGEFITEDDRTMYRVTANPQPQDDQA